MAKQQKRKPRADRFDAVSEVKGYCNFGTFTVTADVTFPPGATSTLVQCCTLKMPGEIPGPVAGMTHLGGVKYSGSPIFPGPGKFKAKVFATWTVPVPDGDDGQSNEVICSAPGPTVMGASGSDSCCD